MTGKEMKTKNQPRKLYIVHGWSYSLELWEPTLRCLAAENVEVKILKVPGLTKPSQKVWTVDAYVTWLDKELKTAQQPIVLGHSNGGRLLLNYCLKHRQKIGHLILLNSAGMQPTPRQRLKYFLLRLISKMAGPLKKVGFIRKVAYRLLGVGDYNQAPANMKLTLRNMLESDSALESQLRYIKTPVSFIWGENDKITPLKAGIFLHSKLRNVRSFRVLEGAAHAPYVSHSQMLTQAILDIL